MRKHADATLVRINAEVVEGELLITIVDNGRGFASKWMTGGSEWRFRGKVTAEEQTGVFRTLGTEVHFALPRHGQSKPIERLFRDGAIAPMQFPPSDFCLSNIGVMALGLDAEELLPPLKRE